MVGIVLVSHSNDLAAAVKALAEQQTQGRAAIAAVGGTGDPEHPFGTDAMAILEAIESVYSDDGVLVLMDLGSALMSTEMAIEFMDEERRPHVHMSRGPFVEGAMAAAVQASIGMDLAAVAREAVGALGPKAESISGSAAEEAGEQAEGAPALSPPAAEEVARVTLGNPAGLHFGPAVLLVQMAAGYPDAAITIRNLTTGAGPVDARRFNQVLGLGAEQGHEVEIRASGPRAREALDALAALAEAGFGEIAGEKAVGKDAVATGPAAPAAVASPTAAGTTRLPEGAAPDRPPIQGHGRLVLRGIPASPGVAVGTACFLGLPAPAAANTEAVLQLSARGADAEWQRYTVAAGRARAGLVDLAARTEREFGPEQGRIFQAHALLLADPDWTDAVSGGIREHHWTAESAVASAAEAIASQYAAMQGARFRERAADVRDVAARVIGLLAAGGASGSQPAPEQTPSAAQLPEDAIIVANDLAPSQTAGLDRSRVIAFCTALGGPTGHSAILARSMGIPAVVGLGSDAYGQITRGARLVVDGETGAVIVAPDPETEAAYRARRAREDSARLVAYESAQMLAHTRDGRRVEVVANLATAADAHLALAAGAEGVGLLRTEFLFQDRAEAPDEDQQLAAYREVAGIMAPRPVIIRTLDVGGDKPAPYLRLPAELNPFLGWRAIRVSLAMPEFFKVQLRAILRAAVDGNVLVMFPMIATRAEVEHARALLAEAAHELAQAGIPHAAALPTGIMVEVPAAAETPDLLAPVVDFFSIGTNDLTQYTFAADRGNPRVAQLGDPLHPAVLRQIGRVIDAAHAAGRWVGLCGELAGRPEAIPVLLGLGLDEFSLAAAGIPAAKSTLARLTVSGAQAIAARALTLPDGSAVRQAVAEMMAADGPSAA